MKTHDEQRKGQPQKIAVANEEKRLVVYGEDLPFGDELRDAPPRDHQHQRGDDGLDADYATSMPFHRPHKEPTPTAARMASASGDVVIGPVMAI